MAVGSFFNTLLGNLQVEETPQFIRVSGIRPALLIEAIQGVWKSSKVSNNIIKASSTEFAFHKFLLPDMVYVLETIAKEKYLRVSRRLVIELIEKLKTETWLKSVYVEKHDNIVDFTQLSKFTVQPLPHQRQYMEFYNDVVPKYKLKGHLLSAGVGVGKTLNSLFLMECLKCDTIVCIVPKNSLENVWAKTLSECFKNPVSFWVSSRMKPLDKGYRYYVTHYENLGNMVEFFKGEGSKLGKVGVVADECLSPDTEVLTPTGFKRITEITENDLVLQYSQSGINTWVKPTRIIKKPTKEAHRYYHQHWEQLVTPNHRMIYLNERGLLRESLSKDFNPNGHQKSIVSGHLVGENLRLCLTPLEKLLIAIQGDGYIYSFSPNLNKVRIGFHFSKERKMDKLLELFEETRYKWTEVFSKADGFDPRFPNKKPRRRFIVEIPFEDLEMVKGFQQDPYAIKLFSSWVDLTDKSYQWCNEFIDEMLNWDGYLHPPVNGRQFLYYSSVIESNVDIVQTIASNAGYRAKKTIQIDDRKETFSDVHRVFMIKNPLVSNSTVFKEVIHFDTPVDYYCLTVPSGMFFVRYNGKVSVTGNCHFLNEIKSTRTHKYLELVGPTCLNSQNILTMSGTPIKAMATEIVPTLRALDPMFVGKAEEIFLNVFGKSTLRALDIISHRLGFMSYRVDKADVVPLDITRWTIQVPLKNGNEYTLDTVRMKMRDYVRERMEYYRKNEALYHDHYFAGIALYEKWLFTSGSNTEKAQYKTYQDYIKTIRKGFDAKMMKVESVYCNAFEKNNILPHLEGDFKKNFKKAKSVYKYVELTILGEALGLVLAKIREQCNIDIALGIENAVMSNNATNEKHIVSVSDLINDATKKTIFFTNFVGVVSALEERLKSLGFKPLVVYGDTNKDLPKITKEFAENPDANPLIATFQSLSTAVPLTMANRVVMLNNPWRPHDYVQAESRAARLGQDSPVSVIDVFLDTKGVPNVSTRSKEVLDWASENVAAMLGVKVDVEQISTESIDSDTEIKEQSLMTEHPLMDMILSNEDLKDTFETKVESIDKESLVVLPSSKQKQYLNW